MSKREERGSQGPCHESLMGHNKGLFCSQWDGKPLKFCVIEGAREEAIFRWVLQSSGERWWVPGKGGSRERGQSQSIS